MHRTGLAAAGQDGGCPWIAVRHEEVSIHLVAMLAREDGRCGCGMTSCGCGRAAWPRNGATA